MRRLLPIQSISINRERQWNNVSHKKNTSELPTPLQSAVLRRWWAGRLETTSDRAVGGEAGSRANTGEFHVRHQSRHQWLCRSRKNHFIVRAALWKMSGWGISRSEVCLQFSDLARGFLLTLQKPACCSCFYLEFSFIFVLYLTFFL